jgi:hypothetical protein
MQLSLVKSLHLAISLLRVKRLFFSLFLGPVLLGLIIVLIQTAGTVALINLSQEDSEKFGTRMSSSTESDFLRGFVFGDGMIPAKPRICSPTDLSPDCFLESYDIVVRNEFNHPVDNEEFQEVFRGAAQRVHFCLDCQSDFVLSIGESKTETKIFSLTGMAVLLLADNRRLLELRQHLADARTEKDRADQVQGRIVFHPPGLANPLAFSEAQTILVVILNVCLTIAIVLWLAIKAHRRVLDYFAKNDVLLPLVASCGKKVVYDALWMLSFARVLVFVLSAFLPFVIVLSKINNLAFSTSLGDTKYFLILWIVAVLFSLGCFGTIVSMSELKQRYPIASALYKIVPIAGCFAGLILWIVAILNGGSEWNIVSSVISVVPIVGLTPTLVAPLSVISPITLVLHILLCGILAVYSLKRSSNWFASHLEEI